MSNVVRQSLAYTSQEQLLPDFASRGLVVLSPTVLGIPAAVHHRVYQQQKRAAVEGGGITPASVPAMLEVLRAPGLVRTCDQLLGRNWAVVPFTHNAPFISGGRDQHWHKDDNAPYNARKQRHHQAVQIEMLYFPQDVSLEMGPTATVPYSQYWTFNHEENHDNFAGADHIDFDYQILGLERQMVSGPDSIYDPLEVVERRTAHDLRMREVIAGTGWPLVRPFEAAPLRAGSVVIYSHNLYHRGNHRRDNWHIWEEQPRFMWRFWLYRTTETAGGAPDTELFSRTLGIDPLTDIDVRAADDDVTVVWRYHHHWLHTAQAPPPRPQAAALSDAARAAEAQRLSAQLFAKHDAAEPRRIGAAYKLASIGDPGLATRLLGGALRDERESVRRAATYGLVAVGPAATPALLGAAVSEAKWVRKAAVYALGDASALTGEVLEVVVDRLRHDSSVYVRAVAAGSLGCLGRRAVASGAGADLIPRCFAELSGSLEREENRMAMDVAQRRSIKFVRPTDDSDVCEGGGVDHGLERFEPVRSAVRENAAWALVILCSHGAEVAGDTLGATIDVLKRVVGNDRNIFVVGMVMDALCRLVHLGPRGVPARQADLPQAAQRLADELPDVLRQSPVRPWESLPQGGLAPERLAEYSEAPYGLKLRRT